MSRIERMNVEVDRGNGQPESGAGRPAEGGIAKVIILVTGFFAVMGAVFFISPNVGTISTAAVTDVDPDPGPTLSTWRPTEPVKLVIMAGKGGGADKLGRFLARTMKTNNLIDQPVEIVNMGANSGADAMRFMIDNAGNPHVLMVTLNSIFTTPLRKPELDIDILEFTPIARIAQDTFLLWVNAEQNIKSVDDYVAAVRGAANQNWQMGGTGSGAEDSLVTGMLERALGIRHRYVPFKGGGSVAKALIKNTVQATVNNPSEQMSYYQAGKSRPIAAFTPQRLKAFPDVPTFRELGHDLVYYMQRSVVAAPGIPSAAKVYYQQLFEQVISTAEWTDYAKRKALDHAFLPGSGLTMYFNDQRARHIELLSTAANAPGG